MRTTLSLIAAAGTLALASAAQAGVSFSFADPSGGRQLSNTAGMGTGGSGMLMYDTAAPLTLIVDGATSGLGATTFAARLEMNLNLGQAASVGGVTLAPVTGSFTLYTLASGSRSNLLTGTASSGSYVRVGATNSILFSDPGFSYSAGPALAPFLGNLTLAPGFEGVFTVTDVDTGGGSLINPNGSFSNFTGNASFSGTAQVIPSPGVIALLGLGTALVARRRRA